MTREHATRSPDEALGRGPSVAWGNATLVVNLRRRQTHNPAETTFPLSVVEKPQDHDRGNAIIRSPGIF